jgi:hypothetical protein
MIDVGFGDIIIFSGSEISACRGYLNASSKLNGRKLATVAV